MRKAIAVLAAIATSAAGVLAVNAQEGGPTVVGAVENAELGTHLVVNGMAVYLFMGDTQDEPPTCYDDCADAWPPVLVTEATTPGAARAFRPRAEGEADQGLIGTVERTDGTTQVTYNDWPLYYYAGDEEEGDVNGHEVEEFGAEWYLLTVEGEPLGE